MVNPVAKTDPASPICGMPILDVVNSKNTIVIKRGKGAGFAGIENALFYADNTRMLYGDGAEMASALVSELKALDGGIDWLSARRDFVARVSSQHALGRVSSVHPVCPSLAGGGCDCK